MLVTDYYERPCPKWPNGRWLTTANKRVIVDNRRIDPTAEYLWQDYPLQDADGPSSTNACCTASSTPTTPTTTTTSA